MVSRKIWGKHALMSFSIVHKLHSSFGLVQFCTFLQHSLVHIFPQIARETILSPVLGNIVCDVVQLQEGEGLCFDQVLVIIFIKFSNVLPYQSLLWRNINICEARIKKIGGVVTTGQTRNHPQEKFWLFEVGNSISCIPTSLFLFYKYARMKVLQHFVNIW